MIKKLLYFLLLCSSTLLAGEPELVLGQIVNRSGEFKKYARSITVGIEACLAQANQQGGINGKKLRLDVRNDGDNPQEARRLAADMMAKGTNIFIGCMGRRTVASLLPEIKNGNLSMLFAWSGQVTKEEDKIHHLINGPGFLDAQLNTLAQHACGEMKIKKIGILHADDTFSTHNAENLKQALIKHGATSVAMESYNRRTLRFNKPCQALAAAEPKAVACVGTSMAMVKLVKSFFTGGNYSTMFLGIDSTAPAKEIVQDLGATIHYAAGVPNPKKSSLPIAKEFVAALQAYDKNAIPNELAFTYYISTKLLIEGLRKNSSREALIKHFEGLIRHDVGGFAVNFDATNRQLFGKQAYLVKD